MNTFQRRNIILEQLKEKNTVLVSDLSKQFNISEVTIRGDLRILEKKNLLTRFHGGASIRQANHFLNLTGNEFTLEERNKISIDPKRRIALAAASMIKPGDTIILDSGSTTMMIAQEIINIKNITVITNNLPAAFILSESADIMLVVCGGSVRHKTRSMHGTITENSLIGIKADIMFVGADGIDPEKGITTFNEGYTISEKMSNISSKVVAVVDSTKFKRQGFNLVLSMAHIDTIITDNALSDIEKKKLAQSNIDIIYT
ncbi:transcriptional regulator [Chelonobacter oris]|uniref:Galactitol utilization operon repressor n=1 Tax=Chelonobacter oris TaxID=505317 RepID=A0A0A3ANJ4_9PAST|nr:DeoR/GlpR family DNA-binding transcription regulator [Chelonobacter oris]KGQ70921.1 galactitol utilization operon repressor [Chelonobacter oris]MDH3000362.1 transcriptional regulator [Chelonobacter oris]